MKVLITDFDLFAKMGGGQTFYRSVILKNPQIDFYYLTQGESVANARPANAHAVPFRENYFLADLGGFFDVSPPKWAYRSFIQASNIAASVAGLEFDLIDSPDYEQWGIFLRPALEFHQVKFSKIALSLHGRISTTLKLDWFTPGKENIPLDLEESQQYSAADLRYGISQSYLDEWRELSALPSHYYHPLHFFDLPAPATEVPNTGAPDLNFIGRTERRKGPDIFLDLVWWLPRSRYSEARIIGPQSFNDTGTVSSQGYLEAMLAQREAPVQLLPAQSQAELLKLFTHKGITILPSRYDTLNLIALESLFSGCPTAIGAGAGVCRLLQESFPEIPWVKIDLENSYACLPELIDVLDNYAHHRRCLVEAVQGINLAVSDPNLEEIYSQPGQSDGEVSQELETWYRQLMTYWRSAQENTSFLQPLKAQVKPVAKQTLKSVKGAFGPLKDRALTPLKQDYNAQWVKAPLLLKKYAATFKAPEQTSREIEDKLQALWRLGSGYKAEQLGVRGKLGINFRIDRARLWRELARLEALRGNTLVSVTYKLRVLRALGTDYFGDLPSVVKTLNGQGFPREAQAAAALYGPPAERRERCFNLIEQARLDNLPNAADDHYEIWDERRENRDYRATIIVSLYNAAEKLPLFLRTLKLQTLIQRGEAEVILVDSGSPGSEYQVFQALAPELGYPLLYVRSAQRETIQSAWNRGIKLARSPYLSFLGVDETILPDCLEVLAQELDQDPALDWVIGDSLVTNVDRNGAWVSDVMTYDRRGYEQDLVYLETCYLSWVGALYRKSIHERFGYYDSSFRGAGDTEFKNRIMPFIKSKAVDRTLGLFWNYPDERTTQSPNAEIEDMRAWYLHRSLGGVQYAFQNRAPEEAENLLYHCLAYRKSYCQHASTDFDHAQNLALYLGEIAPESPALAYAAGITALLKTYQTLDWLPKLSRWSPFQAMGAARKLTQRFEQEHGAGWPNSRRYPPEYRIFNDNRHEQHAFLWFTEIASPRD
ncbi:MAG: glycosyltransferase [Cyanobacteria bacterium RI_101]|nr:glycosyltransferase [Cyanobacteria bacterium RI_101]